MFIDGKIMITLFVLLLITDKFAQTREPHNRHERSSGFRSKHDTTRRKSHKRNTFIFDMKMPGAHSVKVCSFDFHLMIHLRLATPVLVRCRLSFFISLHYIVCFISLYGQFRFLCPNITTFIE